MIVHGSAVNSEAPLSGLVVVELGTSVAAPIGAQIFADLGAKVVKIENPHGGDDARSWGPPFVDGMAATFVAINRNKKSVTVDFKNEAERAALRGFIVREADIVLQNLRPGVVESFGLDAETLRRENPALIYCNLAAFGCVGPMKDKPGYDPLMQAFGGIMSVTGTENSPPVRVGPSIVDQGAGMWAVIGILAALNRRAATGLGCVVDTSLYETALGWMTMHTANYLASRRVPRRLGTENPGIAPYRAFEAADGWIVIAAGNDKLFARLAGVFGRPEWSADPRFATNPERVKNRESLNGMIETIVRTASREVWLTKLDEAGVPCAPMLSLDEVIAHPQSKALGLLQDAPDGGMPLLGLPLQFDRKRPKFRLPPPRLGNANDEFRATDTARSAE
jgi:crotonobetainyl-CoA:carnitine CoA-transferase CaiB-like acyl-CoA transferase